MSLFPSIRLPIRPSVMHHILGTMHYMIIVLGTHMQNDDISRGFFYFFLILIFQAVSGVKEQKIAQNEK